MRQSSNFFYSTLTILLAAALAPGCTHSPQTEEEAKQARDKRDVVAPAHDSEDCRKSSVTWQLATGKSSTARSRFQAVATKRLKELGAVDIKFSDKGPDSSLEADFCAPSHLDEELARATLRPVGRLSFRLWLPTKNFEKYLESLAKISSHYRILSARGRTKVSMRPDAGAKHLARQLDDTRSSLRGEPSDPSAMNLEPVALKRVALMHTDRQKIQAIGPHICSSEQSLAFGSEQTEQLEGQVPSNVTKLWSSYCLESQTLLKGQDISDAKVRKKRTRRRTIYGLEFKLGEETAKDFAKWIEDQRRGKLALVVDNEVLWTAELPESYFGTRLRVIMNPRQPASTQHRLAKRIQTLARSGRLPLSVDKVLINLNRR